MTLKTFVDELNRGDFNLDQLDSLDDFIGFYQGNNLIRHVETYIQGKDNSLELINALAMKAIALYNQLGERHREKETDSLGCILSFIYTILLKHQPSEVFAQLIRKPKSVMHWLNSPETPSISKELHCILIIAAQNAYYEHRLKLIIESCDNLTSVKTKIKKLESLACDPALEAPSLGVTISLLITFGTWTDNLNSDALSPIANRISNIIEALKIKDFSSGAITPQTATKELLGLSKLIDKANPNLQTEIAQRIDTLIECYPTLPKLYHLVLPRRELLTRLSEKSQLILLQSMPAYYNLSATQEHLTKQINKIIDAKAKGKKLIFKVNSENIPMNANDELLAFLSFSPLQVIERIEMSQFQHYICINSDRVTFVIHGANIHALLMHATYSEFPIQCEFRAGIFEQNTPLTSDGVNKVFAAYGFEQLSCLPNQDSVIAQLLTPPTEAPTRVFIEGRRPISFVKQSPSFVEKLPKDDWKCAKY